ncbi:MAG TPA: hypothetical protein VLX59_03850, partial [Acidimicrobiales bacterium]|nr:hypothetical protein [Acidimicrobiales bacterium]
AHWALGHIDWTVAGAYALGVVPAAAVSAQFAQRTPATLVRSSFGWFLIASGAAFAVYRLAS